MKKGDLTAISDVNYQKHNEDTFYFCTQKFFFQYGWAHETMHKRKITSFRTENIFEIWIIALLKQKLWLFELGDSCFKKSKKTA